VAQGEEQAGFAHELLLRLDRSIQVLFDGAGGGHLHVPGAIDRSKTALSEQPDNAIAIVEHLTC
jgi:hypothetical protein